MPKTETIVGDTSLSKEDTDLVHKFEADFNSVEYCLRSALSIDKYTRFTDVVTEYAQKHAGWSDADFLKRIAKIRNLMIHEKREPHGVPVLPTRAIAEELRQCTERLLNPARVLPTFQRTVETTSILDPLIHVLDIIRQRDYSQFPVYEGPKFRGLLTENGVTRWLAQCVPSTVVKLDEVLVLHVLHSEEGRNNYQFVPAEMRVDAVSTLFARHAMLEAVLVTASAKETENLLGIATRWDMLHLA